MKRILYFLLLLAVVMAWRDWNSRDLVHPPGVLVPDLPAQSTAGSPTVFDFKGYTLTRRAAFEVRARVLSRKNYNWGEAADLSPLDLALGWGVMSDQEVLDRIEISQASRWYFTRYDPPAPLSDPEIIQNSANMHMVPADKLVWKELKRVRHGDVIRARGFLVDIDATSGFRWRTSLARDDTGNGSCELFYVEHFQIEARN